MIWFLSLIVAFSTATAPPQKPLREQVTVGTGSIAGAVTDDRTGLPISGAVVSISGTTRPAETEIITDGDGQFIFSGVAAGSYGVTAKRAGYFGGTYGQRQPLGTGMTISLSDGERRAGITMSLVRPAAIMGTVLDEAGEPVVKLEVRAYSRAYLGGRAHYAAIGNATTDDRGAYRIGGLVAGDFLVGVPLTRPRGADDDREGAMPRDGGAISQLPPAGNGKTQVIPAAYFPTGVSATNATAVSVAFGEVRRSVDLQIRTAPAFRISGIVLLPTGTKTGVHVSISAVDEEQFAGSEIASIVVSDGGAFAVGGIPPGQYMLKVETPEAWASEVISVADVDIADIRMTMHNPLRASGRLAFDGSQPAPNAETAQQLQLSVERADGVALTNRPEVSIDRTGANFSITGLVPGRYVVRMNRGLPNWYLKSVMYQGRDVSQSPFEVTSSDVNGLTASFTDRTASIKGTILGSADTAGVTVFIFPQDQQRWVDFGSFGRAFLAADVRSGSFEVPDVPAGDYIAVAIVGDAGMAWRQPSFLQAASRAGSPVRVTDGTATQVDLRVSVIR